MEIYSLKNLSFSYPESEQPALSDISLSIQEGEFITLCGLSGSGKSTLLRQLKSCLQPHGTRSGTILFFGKPLHETEEAVQTARIGLVTQSPDHQSLTDKVWHELAFGLESLGLSRDVIRSRTAETAAFFGMEAYYEKPVAELSGGQKQILNVASVMVMQPSVLILDEPTARLDPIAREEFMSVLQKLNREMGTTILLCEHQLTEAFSMSDRILLMEGGRIVCDRKPAEFSRHLFTHHSPMAFSLPASVRIFEQTENNSSQRPETPDNTTKGRAWLTAYCQSHPTRDVPIQPPIPTGQPLIVLKNIRQRYEREQPDILKGLNLTVFRGEFLSVLGGNGSGKTTLLSLLTGLQKPYSGTIRYPCTDQAISSDSPEKFAPTVPSGRTAHSRLTGKSRLSKHSRSPKISLLPQNPQAVFVRQTVEDDLYEVFSGSRKPMEEQRRLVSEIITFCKLTELLQRHPYDLSGGEQQRAALAKVLLTQPDILLLDEPEKGLDCAFRKELAAMLRQLTENGMTIVAVCHDMEFCAAHADRCVMLFNGEIVSEGSPRQFFSENRFYTTAIHRMSAGVIESAVTDHDLLYALFAEETILSDSHLPPPSGSRQLPSEDSPIPTSTASDCLSHSSQAETHHDITCHCRDSAYSGAEHQHSGQTDSLNRRKKHPVRICLAGMTLLLFVISLLTTAGTIKLPILTASPLLCYGMLFLSAIGFLLLLGKGSRTIPCIRMPKRPGQTVLTVLFLFAAIPLTVWIGVRFLDDSKYLFISLLVMLESLVPFYFLFEKRGIHAKELVLTATLCALCVAGRALFYMLPEFKPLTALVIIFAVSLGEETGFLIGSASMLISNIFFGQGMWTPWQMFAMGLIGYLGGLLFHRKILPLNRISLAIFGFLAALVIYGGIMNPAALLLSRSVINGSSLLTVYLLGLPLDTVHAVSTAVFLYLGAEPMLVKLERIKRRSIFSDRSAYP